MSLVQAATLLMPAGLIAAFRPLTHASLFLVLYGVTAIYFSGVMVRSQTLLKPPAAPTLQGLSAAFTPAASLSARTTCRVACSSEPEYAGKSAAAAHRCACAMHCRLTANRISAFREDVATRWA